MLGSASLVGIKSQFTEDTTDFASPQLDLSPLLPPLLPPPPPPPPRLLEDVGEREDSFLKISSFSSLDSVLMTALVWRVSALFLLLLLLMFEDGAVSVEEPFPCSFGCFCWVRRSVLRNFALLFWNQTCNFCYKTTLNSVHVKEYPHTPGDYSKLHRSKIWS